MTPSWIPSSSITRTWLIRIIWLTRNSRLIVGPFVLLVHFVRSSTACRSTRASGRGPPAENTTCPSSHGAGSSLLRETSRQVISPDTLLLAAVAAAHGCGPRLDLPVSQDDHHGHLLFLGQPDLVLHPAVRAVHVHAEPALSQERRQLVSRTDMPVGDGNERNLDRRNPQREGAPEVLDENPDEPLERAVDRPVDGDRALARAVHRDSHRALRGRPPAVGCACPGCAHSHRRPACRSG